MAEVGAICLFMGMDDAPAAEHWIEISALGARLRGLRLSRPKATERMSRSLEQHGQICSVTAFVDSGELQILDGFKRLRAAQGLGWPRLRTHVLEVDEVSATMIVRICHEQHPLTELEEAWIVQCLCRTHGLSQGAVGKMMQRHKSWVYRRLRLAEGLDTCVQTDVRLGLLPARSALALAALPRGNQRAVAEVVMQRGMTTRQAERLVRRWKTLDEAGRQALLLAPDEPVGSSAAHAPRPRSAHEYLMVDIARTMQAGVKLEVRLLDLPIQSEGTAVAKRALTELSAMLTTLSGAIQRALSLQEKVDEVVNHH